MAITKYIEPHQVWNFYVRNFDRLLESDAILYKTDLGYEVLLSATGIAATDGRGVFRLVNSNGSTLFQEAISTFAECATAALEMQRRLMVFSINAGTTPAATPAKDEPEPPKEKSKPASAEKPKDDPAEWEGLIDEREDGLLMAFYDFLEVVLMEERNDEDSIAGFDAESIFDSLDVVLDTIHRTCDMPVFRPTILLDENNTEYIEQYPYGDPPEAE